MLPQGPQRVPLVVHPGDAVTVSIAEQATGSWLIAFRNNTSGATYDQTVRYDSSHSSAEWIVEAPSAGRRQRTLPLDNFGTVAFSEASAVKDGQRLTLAQTGATPITMTDRSERALAVPSGVTGDGAGFSVARTDVVQPPAPARPSGR
jgi:hypothetical protein